MHKLLIPLCLVMLFGCKPEEHDEPAPAATTGTLEFNVEFRHKTNKLIYDTIMYQNAAGNHYSVSTVKAILSSIKLLKNMQASFTDKGYYFIDARDAAYQKIILNNIPAGTYSGIEFLIGIDSLHNKHDSLPQTTYFQNMLWPTMMGGGYHFLKFEGQFLSAGNPLGYTLHLGTNGYTSLDVITFPIDIKAGEKRTLKLIVDVNEWFDNPYPYNLETDGYAIMGDKPAMQKVADNGSDVLSIE